MDSKNGDLYSTQLVEQLKNISEVKHLDLWNENVVYADQDEPWRRQAVFGRVWE